jgi:hypothetical protein
MEPVTCTNQWKICPKSLAGGSESDVFEEVHNQAGGVIKWEVDENPKASLIAFGDVFLLQYLLDLQAVHKLHQVKNHYLVLYCFSIDSYIKPSCNNLIIGPTSGSFIYFAIAIGFPIHSRVVAIIFWFFLACSITTRIFASPPVLLAWHLSYLPLGQGFHLLLETDCLTSL